MIVARLRRVAVFRNNLGRNMADVQTILEERIKKLEFITGQDYVGQGTTEVVRDVQLEILHDLYALQDALSKDLSESGSLKSTAPTNESEELLQLREENKKLKYRIAHMKRFI